MSIGNLTLEPEFAPHILEYYVETFNDTNTITIAAKYKSADVTIEFDGNDTIDSGDTLTWASGENEVLITVSYKGEETEYKVTVVKKEHADSSLSSLAFDKLSLDSAFDSATQVYTATTAEAKDTITATATELDAVITITLNGDEIENEVEFDWADDENVVVITVNMAGDGEFVEPSETKYTITVTKTT